MLTVNLWFLSEANPADNLKKVHDLQIKINKKLGSGAIGINKKVVKLFGRLAKEAVFIPPAGEDADDFRMRLDSQNIIRIWEKSGVHVNILRSGQPNEAFAELIKRFPPFGKHFPVLVIGFDRTVHSLPENGYLAVRANDDLKAFLVRKLKLKPKCDAEVAQLFWSFLCCRKCFFRRAGSA